MKTSTEAAIAIIKELNGRSGFDHWWREIDGEIQDEITNEIAEIVDRAIAATKEGV